MTPAEVVSAAQPEVVGAAEPEVVEQCGQAAALTRPPLLVLDASATSWTPHGLGSGHARVAARSATASPT